MATSAAYTRNLPEGATMEVLGDAYTGYIVNVARESGEEAVRIPPSISAKLKTHQVSLLFIIIFSMLTRIHLDKEIDIRVSKYLFF